ncbi:Triosephosphate isomerase [Microthyrium microscopicum]|uniref:Triosephosphate isomerase n=1 Tax=Microthyrium microscopicum TaxID=703497 RepID=A0A6A6U4E3_9PEZI|nr:Triosephosphate isomerase [Microthyrium microscopicum]
MARKFLVAANYKMNGSIASVRQLIQQLNESKLDPDVEVVISPPCIYILLARETLKPGIEISAQNVSDKPAGAFTGETSVEHLKDVGATWTILGHSERRQYYHETDAVVASKTKFALDNGLGTIVCCGESLEERESGKTVAVVEKQLKAVVDAVKDWSKIVVAYEPIWAIGTGKVATTEQAQEVHVAIRKFLAKEVSSEVAEATRILYGGSVSEKNCKELAKQADIDGFLVGGASLKPAFIDIINAKQ